MGRLRETLGLDTLSIESAPTANSASGGVAVSAGRYVGRDLYVGVKQNFSGGTRAVVQYDVTRRIKLQAIVNTGTTTATTPSTAQQDNGSSIGVSYEFDY